MKKFLSVLVVLLVVAVPSAFALDTSAQVKITNTGDPCQNPNVAKSSAVVSVATGTTGQLVALTSAQSIYVCALSTSLTGTTGNDTSFQLVSGTTTTTPCDTGAANISAAYKVNSQAAGGTFQFGYGGTLFKTASGKALCSTTTGTNSVLTGMITYVKQ